MYKGVSGPYELEVELAAFFAKSFAFFTESGDVLSFQLSPETATELLPTW